MNTVDFNKADKKVHKVEDQWHYNALTRAGFVPIDKEGVGFVRQYRYQKGDEIITGATGVHADTWSSNKGGGGYYGSLYTHLKVGS